MSPAERRGSLILYPWIPLPDHVAKRTKPATPTNGKKHGTQQSVDAAIWSICDIMRRGNVASALQYPAQRLLASPRVCEQFESVDGQF